MNLITILEKNRIEECKKNWFVLLSIEKYFIEKYFHWIKLEIKGKVLVGNGVLKIGDKTYSIKLSYSPFFFDYSGRFETIKINDKTIKYNSKIHLYNDLSLCLYHPKIDKPILKTIPLFNMIPWISEWCVHYEEWKKYGVWLGKEIKH